MKYFKEVRICKFCLFFISFLILAASASAKVEISIKNDFLQRNRIAVFGLDNVSYDAKKEAELILQKLSNNLSSTGLFEVVLGGDLHDNLSNNSKQKSEEITDQKTNISIYSLKKELTFNDIPDFEKYEKAKLDILAIFNIYRNSASNIEVRIKVWDVADRREILNKTFVSMSQNLNKVSNIVSNEIYTAATGESKGHFATKILYVAETGNFKNRIKKITSIDFDGQNYRSLTDGSDVVLTPIFSKKPDEIYYVRYFQDRPQIFAMNLVNQKIHKIGGYRGTSLSPNPHPVYSDLVLLTAIEDGNSDIHQLDIGNNIARRITKSPAIDTTANYSPDGKFIVFSSDREGGQQIFRMSNDGSNVERISRGEGTYAKPQISPDGRFIAFTKIFRNKFSIGIMTLNGKNEKILVNSYLVEGAKWSPSGRYLIYSKKAAPYGKDSIPRLWIVDVLTGFEFEIPTPPNEGAVDPDWGRS